MSKVVVMDTSILCCWLNIPGKETCGPTGNQWDNERVKKEIENEMKQNATLVLPLATIIETGNHIAQANRNRYEIASEFAGILNLTAESKTPWAAFTDQSILWDVEGLKTLAEEWPKLAAQGLAIGDSTIKNVANYYAAMGKAVEILTGDQLLQSYTPAKSPQLPRRRK